MTNINLTTTEWTELTGLTADTTYFIQSKYDINYSVTDQRYAEQKILFTKSATKPAELDDGLEGRNFKFTVVSGAKYWVRATVTPTNLQIEEL